MRRPPSREAVPEVPRRRDPDGAVDEQVGVLQERAFAGHDAAVEERRPVETQRAQLDVDAACGQHLHRGRDQPAAGTEGAHRAAVGDHHRRAVQLGLVGARVELEGALAEAGR